MADQEARPLPIGSFLLLIGVIVAAQRHQRAAITLLLGFGLLLELATAPCRDGSGPLLFAVLVAARLATGRAASTKGSAQVSFLPQRGARSSGTVPRPVCSNGQRVGG